MTDDIFSSAEGNPSQPESDRPLELPELDSDSPTPQETDSLDRELLALFEDRFHEGEGSLSLEDESVGDIDFEAIALELEESSLSADDIAPLAAEKVMEMVEIPSTEPSESEKPWFNLAQKLREQNQTLIQRVVELERVLSDAKQRYQSETRRSRSLDEEIASAQAHLQELREQLTFAQQESQQQRLQLETQTENSERAQANFAQMERNFIEQQQAFNRQAHQINQLTEALTLSHSRAAQLERTCTHLQEELNGKTHQLSHLEAQVPELQLRLQRQQRFALEYREALDRALADRDGDSLPLPTAGSAIVAWSKSEPEAAASQGEIPTGPDLAIAESTVGNPSPTASESDGESPTFITEESAAISTEEAAELDRFVAYAEAAEPALQPKTHAVPMPEFIPLSANRTHPRRLANFPSFSITPQTKPVNPAAKKVELPAFLRNR